VLSGIESGAIERGDQHSMNDLEKEVAQVVIESLNLQDVRLEDIRPDEALYGEGLGLDSIDILEVALVVSKRYGFELRSDDPNNEKIFSSIATLADHIRAHRTQ
jgi:acyl carrier protein